MALPTLQKTWIHSVNTTIATGSSPAGYGETMFAWKVFLTTGLSPWVVVASSDGSAFGASDLWINAAACTTHGTPGSAHCWIVLQNDAIATGFQMCVDLDDNGGGGNTIMAITISEAAGFTGGTLTNRPTAADEVVPFVVANSEQWTGALDLTVNPGQLHMQRSDDGEITRWWIYVNGTLQGFASIEKPADAVPGWAIPWIAVVPIDRYASANYVPSYTYLNDGKDVCASRAKGSRTGHYLSSEGVISSMLGQLMTFGGDLDSGNFPMFPIGIWCDEAPARGRLGRLTDLWWGSTAANDGDHYPGDASRQFAQVGDLIVPWPGGGPMLIS